MRVGRKRWRFSPLELQGDGTTMGSTIRDLTAAARVALFAVAVAIALPAEVGAQNRLPAPGAPAGGFADLAERLLPAVVNISTTQVVRPERPQAAPSPGPGSRRPEMPQFPPGSPFEEFFKDFFDRQGRGAPDQTPRRAQSLGSGFIIDPSGIVVTNNHVIAEADEIKVTLHDNTQLNAKLIVQVMVSQVGERTLLQVNVVDGPAATILKRVSRELDTANVESVLDAMGPLAEKTAQEL